MKERQNMGSRKVKITHIPDNAKNNVIASNVSMLPAISDCFGGYIISGITSHMKYLKCILKGINHLPPSALVVFVLIGIHCGLLLTPPEILFVTRGWSFPTVAQPTGFMTQIYF